MNKYFRHIRKFVNLAINKDLFDLNKYPFRKFKAKTESTKREYLTPEEVERLEDLTLPEDKKHLKKIVDMFLFSCYTFLALTNKHQFTNKLQSDQGVIGNDLETTGLRCYALVFVSQIVRTNVLIMCM